MYPLRDEFRDSEPGLESLGLDKLLYSIGAEGKVVDRGGDFEDARVKDMIRCFDSRSGGEETLSLVEMVLRDDGAAWFCDAETALPTTCAMFNQTNAKRMKNRDNAVLVAQVSFGDIEGER